MADKAFGAGLIVGVQSGFGTPNNTITDLVSGGGAGAGGAIDTSNGYVLGDGESGDGETGITLPSLDGDFRDVAAVANSFSEQPDSYLKTLITGFSIAVQMKGNGLTATPALGEGIPFAGVDVLNQMSGLSGGNGGANAEYDYTPASATVYGTVKLWVSDLAMIFTDCLVDSVSYAMTPGDAGIATYNISVGAFTPGTTPTGSTRPYYEVATTPDFLAGNQTGNAPVIAGVGNAWGTTRGFNDLTITIANAIETFGDSNVLGTGLRQSQTERVVNLNGTIYMDDVDEGFEIEEMYGGTQSDLSFTVGTLVTGATAMNAYRFECNDIQPQNVKQNRIGANTSVEFSGKCTATAAGGEFTLVYG